MIEDKLTFRERLFGTFIVCFFLCVISTIITLNNIDIYEYVDYYINRDIDNKNWSNQP